MSNVFHSHEENEVDNQFTTASLEETSFEHEESDSSVTDLPEDFTILCPSDKKEEFRNDSFSDEQNTKEKRRTRLPARFGAFVTGSDGDRSDTEKNSNNEWKPNKNKKLRSSNAKRNRLVTLRVGLVKNSPCTDLSNNDFSLESPLQTILCQQKLSKCDFFKQLRSTFPELGENEAFDAYLASSTNTSAPYKMTQNELYKMFKSLKQNQCDFYLQRKEPGTSGKSKKTSLLLNEKTSSNVLEEETPLEKEGIMDLINGIVDTTQSAPQTEAGEEDTDEDNGDCDDNDDDLWKPEQNDEDNRLYSPELKQTIRRTGDQNLKCQVCGYLFRYESLLTKHSLSHLDHPKCMCGVCGQQSNSSEELELHLGTHQKIYKCDICAQYFLKHISLQKHIATHGTEKPFQCHICQQAFVSDKLLKKHQVKHNNKPYKCDFCPWSFSYKSLLKAHRQKHTGEKLYCCDVCGKSLSDYRSLHRHKLTHSGEKTYSCQTCGKTFYTLDYLKRHEKIHTVRERKYLCDICSKTFVKKQELLSHQIIHGQSHIVKCPLCDKLFKRKSYLDLHMRTHKEEKPYVCSQCGNKFKFRQNLKVHMATHLSVKPLTCSVCGYKCVRKHYLDTHMRTHTGLKPYQCALCDKAFTQSHCLKTHMKSHQA